MEITPKSTEIDLPSNVKIHLTTISVTLHTGSRIGSCCSSIFFTNITHLKNTNKILKMKIHQIRVTQMKQKASGK